MKFLIVDDEPLIRRALVRSFALRGHACDEAANGKDALELLAKNDYKAILLDMIMPEKNGFEVLQEMNKDIKVFIISAFSGDDTNVGFVQNDHRVQAYITKPFDQVLDVVDRVLGKI